MSTKRRIATIAAAGVIALGLAACSSNSGTGSTAGGAADSGDPADGLKTTGHHGRIPSGAGVQGEAEVRRATRSVAERARGLRSSSASPGRTGLVTASKVGAGPAWAAGSGGSAPSQPWTKWA